MAKNIKVFYWNFAENNFLISFWNILQKKLERKGYNFQLYETKKEPNWDNIIDDISKGTYDIGISSFFYKKERLKKTDYTYPITEVNTSLYYIDKHKNFFRFFIKESLPFIMLLIILSLICSTIIYFADSKNFSYKIYSIFCGFFGQSGEIQKITNFNKNNTIIMYGIIIIFIYFITVILYAVVIGKTIYFRGLRPFYNIQNKKIIINRALSYHKKRLEKLGAKVYVYEEKKDKNGSALNFFLNNKNNFDGIMTEALEFLDKKSNKRSFDFNYKNKNIELVQSKINFGTDLVGFPINRNKKEFVKDLQSIFMDTLISNLSNVCQKTVKNDLITFCRHQFQKKYI